VPVDFAIVGKLAQTVSHTVDLYISLTCRWFPEVDVSESFFC
jgi:hypothetical protein